MLTTDAINTWKLAALLGSDSLGTGAVGAGVTGGFDVVGDGVVVVAGTAVVVVVVVVAGTADLDFDLL
jgi:hypothetical protein